MRHLATAALVCAALVSAPPSAHAASADAVVLQFFGGYGSDFRSIGMFGDATVVGTDGIPTTYGCGMDGPVLHDAAGDVGTLNGGCGPWPLTCVFTRVGVVANLTCLTPTVGVLEATGTWIPHDVLPTTSFDVTLAGAIVCAGGEDWTRCV